MIEKRHRAREKIVQKMTKHGLAQKNLSTGEEENISQQEADFLFSVQDQEPDREFHETHSKRPPRERSRQSRLVYRSFETDDAIGSSRLQYSNKELEQDGFPDEGGFEARENQEEVSNANGGLLGVGSPEHSGDQQQWIGDNTAAAEKLNLPVDEVFDEFLPKGYGVGDRFLINTWRQSLIWKSTSWTEKKLARGGQRLVHQKIQEYENDNLGLKAAHTQEKVVEKLSRNFLQNGKKHITRFRQRKTIALKRATKIANKKFVKLSKADLRLKKALKKPTVSAWQKRRLQQKYATAKRKSKKAAEVAAKATEGAAKSSSNAIIIIAQRVMKFFAAIVSWAFAIVGGGIIVVMIICIAVLGVALFFNVTIIATSYLAEDIDIHDASLEVTRLEAELDKKIKDIPSSPQWSYIDEFRYSLDPIGHNPYVLMGWLTVKYDDFKFTDVAGHLQELHNARYDLQLDVETETRENDENEEYTWYILNVTLHSKSIEEVIEPELELDISGDLRDRLEVLMESKGSHQIVSNPFDYDWTGSFSSLYGYRVDPIGGTNLQIHRGLDLPAPKGTPIRAGVTGSVIETGYNDTFGNYMLIKDEKNDLVIKYAHCDRLLLSSGAPVKAGETIIALVGNTGGSTGNHLHIEVKENGQYLNPIFATDWENSSRRGED